MGLMQIMPATGEYLAGLLRIEYSGDMLLDPDYNIRLGTYYLSRLLKRFDLNNAIAAYNAGETRVANWIAQDIEIPFSETREYLRKVRVAKRVYDILLTTYN